MFLLPAGFLESDKVWQQVFLMSSWSSSLMIQSHKVCSLIKKIYSFRIQLKSSPMHEAGQWYLMVTSQYLSLAFFCIGLRFLPRSCLGTENPEFLLFRRSLGIKCPKQSQFLDIFVHFDLGQSRAVKQFKVELMFLIHFNFSANSELNSSFFN